MKRINLNFAAGLLIFLVLLALPALMDACPLCAASTPYKKGIQWAVALLLPIPFVLVGGLVYFIRQASNEETTES